jgi:uncharacterized membrane protein
MLVYYLKLYLLTFIAFLAIDAVWLGLIAKGFYAKHLGYLMAEQPNLVAALVFYLIFVVAILALIVIPNLQAPLAKTLLMAALFGFASYATYDLTNLATIKDWPLIVTIVDLIWGTSIATITAFIARLIAQRL